MSLKPYESGNGKLSFDPHDVPVSSYQWLPTPPRRLDIDERDFMVFERSTRATLRALNFNESVLHTWKAREDQDFLLAQFRMSITRAVKCAMQAQVASHCGSIQLRRDHNLSVARACLSALVDIQEIR